MGETNAAAHTTQSHRYHMTSETDTKPVNEAEQTPGGRGNPIDHGPDIYVVDDFITDGPRFNSSIPVVKPYAIEEPDDDVTCETQRSILPQQRPKPWEDLVTSMEDLYCDSDNSSSSLLLPKRGRKRKPVTTSTFLLSEPSRPCTPMPDVQYEKPSLSPKRPRRREQRSRKDPASYEDVQGDRIYNAGALGGSSSASISTDTSGANSAKGSPAPDAMDI
ncbi:hypothetical protein BJY04DRAFT_193284, partial [Aspergillus karnatakaensis]|uniref:uncharacterized protein n=1 Tax=Aspergillus karnatakaensis TaxID=1810916 RepID=UPI003CCD14FA